MKCSVVTVVILAVLIKVLWPPPLPTKERTFEPYDPTLSTDIEARMGYMPSDFRDGPMETVLYGLSYDLQARFIRHLLSFVGQEEKVDKGYQQYEDSKIPVPVLDARRLDPPPSLDVQGFELLTLPNMEPEEQMLMQYEPLKPKIEAYLRSRYPDTKDFVWTFEVQRMKSDDYDGQIQPRTEGNPHLDYSADHNATKEFYQRYPNVADAPELIVNGHPTNPELKLTKLLGIWKPTNMTTPVCRNSLAVMDARTFEPEDHVNNELHMYFDMFGLLKIFTALGGVLKYAPGHQWYYFSHQTIDEVFLFTQWSPQDFFATPHTGILVKNCPEEFESRISLECRIGLFA